MIKNETAFWYEVHSNTKQTKLEKKTLQIKWKRKRRVPNSKYQMC